MARIEVAGSLALEGFELAPGELEEGGGVALQRLRGERLEGLGEARAGVLEQRQLLRRGAPLGVQPRLGLGPPRRRLGPFADGAVDGRAGFGELAAQLAGTPFGRPQALLQHRPLAVAPGAAPAAGEGDQQGGDERAGGGAEDGPADGAQRLHGAPPGGPGGAPAATGGGEQAAMR